MKAKINEIFDSIQGEGLYLGERQLFIRFFGCNLGCRYCDEKLVSFTEYDLTQLINILRPEREKFRSISFTGGEPLVQADFLKEILKLTRYVGFCNYLETNGTLPDELSEVIGDVDIVAMDIKLPSSTGLAYFWDKHLRFLDIASRKEVFLKSVICSTTTEEDIFEAIKLIKKVNPTVLFVLQPNCYEDYAKLAEKMEQFKARCRKEGITACVIGQVHKKIGRR